MQIDFFHSYPYRTLEPDLQSLVLGARRPDAAVAFVTPLDCMTSPSADDNDSGRTR